MSSERRSRPLVPIRAIWDKDSVSKYPETLRVPMDDGNVINYVIDQEKLPHPCFLKALDIIKNMPLGSYRHKKDPDL